MTARFSKGGTRDAESLPLEMRRFSPVIHGTKVVLTLVVRALNVCTRSFMLLDARPMSVRRNNGIIIPINGSAITQKLSSIG
jgi:hypothetical protein